MVKDYVWCENCYYEVIDGKGEILEEAEDVNCFRKLPNDFPEGSIIHLYNFHNEKTLKYTDFYLKYIVDMLKLKGVVIEGESFYFDAFESRNKNLLVLMLIRILFESLGYQSLKGKYNNELFELLLKGKSPYKNKFKRFCYFYRSLKVGQGYWAEGHTPKPSKVEIRSTSDFVRCKFNNLEVNMFFYGYDE